MLLAFLTPLTNLLPESFTKVAKVQCCHRNQWQLVPLTPAVNMPLAPLCQGWICNPCQWHPGGRGVNITLNFWKKSTWISWRRSFMDQLEVKNLVSVRFYVKTSPKSSDMVPWHFGTDPDLRIHTTDLRIRIRICFFSSVGDKMPTKISFSKFFLLSTGTAWSYIYISL